MGTVEHVGFPQVSGMIESLDGANRFSSQTVKPVRGARWCDRGIRYGTKVYPTYLSVSTLLASVLRPRAQAEMGCSGRFQAFSL